MSTTSAVIAIRPGSNAARVTAYQALKLILVLAFVLPAHQSELKLNRPQEGSCIRRTITKNIDYDKGGTGILLNGKSPSGTIHIDHYLSISAEYVILDRYLSNSPGASGDFRDSVLERTFERVSGSGQVVSTHEGDQRIEVYESPLQGTRVLFRYDRREDDYVVDVQDCVADDIQCSELIADMDFQEILPPSAVEQGDSWEVDLDVIVQLFRPGGIRLTPEEFFVVGGQDAPTAWKGSVRATFNGVRKEDGGPLAEIGIRAAFEASHDVSGEMGGRHARQATSLEAVLTGRILWSQEEGRLHALSLHGSLLFKSSIHWTNTGSNTSIEQPGELVLEIRVAQLPL